MSTIGLDKLYFAKITEAAETGYETYASPVSAPGVQSADITLNNAIEAGTLKIVQLYAEKPTGSWIESAPSNWTTGYLKDGIGTIDLRFVPSVFILDENLQLTDKNITVDELKESLQ